MSDTPVWPEEDSSKINLKIYDPAFYRDFFDETQFPKEITWYQNIQGLFTEYNARCMISKGKSDDPSALNLTSYDAVSNAANIILEKLRSKKMPPGDPWSNYQMELFRKWIEDFNCKKGDFVPSATEYDKKIIRAPLRYQYPDYLPEDFIATFYQNVKPLFTSCDQKFGLNAIDDKVDSYYNVDVFSYKSLRDAANAAEVAKKDKNLNIINDIRDKKFPLGNPWPQTWINVLDNWIKYGCKEGEPPLGMERI